MKPQIPWPRILAEGFAIVVSILLAFGIQAWWESSQERAQERTLLTALHSELSDARQEFADQIDILREDIEATAEHLRALQELNDGVPPDSLMSVLMATGPGPSNVFRPPRAALDDVLNGGGLG